MQRCHKNDNFMCHSSHTLQSRPPLPASITPTLGPHSLATGSPGTTPEGVSREFAQHTDLGGPPVHPPTPEKPMSSPASERGHLCRKGRAIY